MRNRAQRFSDHPYLISTLAVLLLALMVMSVSWYYAAYYPTTNVTALPRTSISGLLVTIFNGYTEKVSAGSSLSSIRAAAQENVADTIVSLVLAIALMMAYLTQRRLADPKWKLRLLGMFLLALVSSQYFIAGYQLYTLGYYATGTSFFQVDSAFIVILFSIVIGVKSYSRLLKERQLQISILLIALILVLALLTIGFGAALIENLGYLMYNPAFAGTYNLHAIGLISFAWFFLCFWSKLPKKEWFSVAYWRKMIARLREQHRRHKAWRAFVTRRSKK